MVEVEVLNSPDVYLASQPNVIVVGNIQMLYVTHVVVILVMWLCSVENPHQYLFFFLLVSM